MIAREDFDAYGIDYAPSAVELCEQMLRHWSTRADLRVGDMIAIPHPDATFDAVLDVFSAYCLNKSQFELCAADVARVLKPGGRFFSYTPSKTSDAWRNPGPAQRIDSDTLDGIKRESSPYCGSEHTFRFVDADEYVALLERHGLSATYREIVGLTYYGGAESFEWVVIEASRQNV
jgi:SAM-dependent methyltransferase